VPLSVPIEPVPALVTLHLWRVPRRRIGWALGRMGLDRARLRRTPGVRFAKMLGTGDGRTFTVRDSDATRWGALTCWTSAEAAADVAVHRDWAAASIESWRVDLRPLSSRGRWSGRTPFGDPQAARYDGPVAAITRARLSATKAAGFWRAVPPVSADLHRSPGLRAAIGIGEAPIGLQGTFSLWSSGAALRDFAHRGSPHVEVIRRTAEQGWYAEELFARFAILGSSGSLDGADPLA